MTMERIIVLGATSAIAQAVMQQLASPSARMVLVARNDGRVAQVAQDLLARGCAEARTVVADLDDVDGHADVVERCWSGLGGCDLLLLAYGTLPDQDRCEDSVAEALSAFHTNAVSAVALLTAFADRFVGQGSGTMAVISSVAGDRGRRSNYVYGSAKAALSTFAAGLRGRFAGTGVHVLTIKPGLVDTPMTADIRKGMLWADPDTVASRIVQGVRKRRDVVYAPAFWRLIMWIVRAVPEPLFKRLNL